MHTGTTLTQFIIEEQRRTAGATGDFTSLLNDVVTACKAISNAVNKGALLGVMGSLDSENVQGETQKKLDVITNEIMIRSNEWAGHLAGMASEEMDEVYAIPNKYPLGKYLLVFDPLDGSSNVDVNISVGTIFSILKAPVAGRAAKMEDFLQTGTQQVCAGYAIYGSSTMLVLTFGNGTNGFTLDRDVGEFVLTHPNMKIPAETKEFAINASNMRFWEKPVPSDCWKNWPWLAIQIAASQGSTMTRVNPEPARGRMRPNHRHWGPTSKGAATWQRPRPE